MIFEEFLEKMKAIIFTQKIEIYSLKHKGENSEIGVFPESTFFSPKHQKIQWAEGISCTIAMVMNIVTTFKVVDQWLFALPELS